jgi:hypothetical protein
VHKLVWQIAVSSMDFHSVGSSLDCISGSSRRVSNVIPDLTFFVNGLNGLVELTFLGMFTSDAETYGRPFSSKNPGRAALPRSRNWMNRQEFFFMDASGDFPPSSNMRISP